MQEEEEEEGADEDPDMDGELTSADYRKLQSLVDEQEKAVEAGELMLHCPYCHSVRQFVKGNAARQHGTGCRNAVASLLVQSHNSWTITVFSRQCMPKHVQPHASVMSVHQRLSPVVQPEFAAALYSLCSKSSVSQLTNTTSGLSEYTP